MKSLMLTLLATFGVLQAQNYTVQIKADLGGQFSPDYQSNQDDFVKNLLDEGWSVAEEYEVFKAIAEPELPIEDIDGENTVEEDPNIGTDVEKKSFSSNSYEEWKNLPEDRTVTKKLFTRSVQVKMGQDWNTQIGKLTIGLSKDAKVFTRVNIGDNLTQSLVLPRDNENQPLAFNELKQLMSEFAYNAETVQGFKLDVKISTK